MIRAGAGLSHEPDPVLALELAVGEARAALGAEPAFAVLAATPDRFAERARFEGALRAVLPATPLAGTSSDRVLVPGPAGEVPDKLPRAGALAVLLVAGDVDAVPFCLPPLEATARSTGDAADHAARECEELLACAVEQLPGRATSVLLFADPRSGHVPLLARICARGAPGAMLAGGGSTGRGADLFQLGERGIHSGAATGLVLGARGSRVGVSVSHGGQPVGVRGTITRCERGRILEVDGRPATSLLERLRDGHLPVRPEEAAPLLALALAPGGPDALAAGQFLVRNLAGVDPERGALLVAARLEPGWAASLLLREAIGAREEVFRNAQLLSEGLDGRIPAAGVYFDCASRGESLYGCDGVDLRHLRRGLGEFPFLGVTSSFELGPLVVGEAAGPALHLYSGVLWTLTDEAAPARAVARGGAEESATRTGLLAGSQAAAPGRARA